MSLLWCDDFGSYGTGGTSFGLLSNGPYGEVGNFVHQPSVQPDPDPLVVGGVCFRPCGSIATNDPFSGNNALRKVLPSNKTTVGCGLRLWLARLPSVTTESAVPIVFRDANNTILFSLWITPTGAIDVNVNAATWVPTPLVSTSGPVLLANAWQHIEVKATFSATVGAVEVRVDGVTVINATNVDTIGAALSSGAASIAQVYDAQAGGATPIWYIKDYIIWDTAGSKNNDFFSTVRVIRLPVDGDVALNWTPSTGSTGYNLLNESPPNDTTYISAAWPAPSPCVMSFANLPPDITSVRALMTFVRASNSDGGDGKLQTSLVSGGSDANGADRQITVAKTWWWDISETDPNTAANWTPASTDAANIKFNRTL